jgi:glycosyltransferase involved in cell wall biosynthesis
MGSRRETAPTVMQVTPNLAIGGAQETVRTLAKYLPRVGYPVVVCSFDDGPLRDEMARLEVPIELLPTRRHSVVSLPSFVIEMLRLRRRLLALVRAHHVGIVQTQGLGTLDFLVMTLRLGGHVRVWWTIQNQHFEVRAEHLVRHGWLLRPKRLTHRWLYLLGARLVDGVIAVSDETARSFREVVGYRGDKLHVVFNAVDVERYPAAIDRDEVRARLGFGPGDHVMTMVGTFKRQKGHRYLVEAAANVIPRFPRLHVLLVGDGALAEETRERIEASGLIGRVRLLGTRRDVPELLAASDSFVLPSLWEGLPIALVEAMASRLPVIATEVSGTSQVMVDGETGWLVAPGDPAGLSEAMAELLSNPARASTMAAAGRERVAASFGARTQAERLVALFRRHDVSPDHATSTAVNAVRAP